MRVLAGIDGVRHVTELRLAAPGGQWSEATFGIPARGLVELTELVLDVRGDS